MAFSDAEYAERLARVRRAMAAQGLDLLLLHNLPSVCYLTGYQTPVSDWYTCLIVPLEGDLTLQFTVPEISGLAGLHLYFHALADNRGVMTVLADRAAEEDIKEEMLLYSVLAKDTVHVNELHDVDAAIEQQLFNTFGLNLNFDLQVSDDVSLFIYMTANNGGSGSLPGNFTTTGIAFQRICSAAIPATSCSRSPSTRSTRPAKPPEGAW